MPAKYFCLFCENEMKDEGYQLSMYFSKNSLSYSIQDILPDHLKDNPFCMKEICDSCRIVICDHVKKAVKSLTENKHKDLREIYKLECTK